MNFELLMIEIATMDLYKSVSFTYTKWTSQEDAQSSQLNDTFFVASIFLCAHQ